MELSLLLIAAFVMGLLSAIPLGAVQIEIAKRAFDDQVAAALMIVVGSVVSDVMYGFIALFGLAPALSRPAVVAWFWLGGTLVLAILAVITYRQATRSTGDVLVTGNGVSNRLSVSLVTGFSLALANPMMIVWWLAGAQLLVSYGIVTEMTRVHSVVFLVGGGTGLAVYLSALTRFLKKAKRFMSPKVMRRTTYGMAIGLALLAILFLVRSLNVLAA